MRKQYKELTPAEKMIVGLIYDVYSQFYYERLGSTHLKNARVHDLRDLLKTNSVPELDKYINFEYLLGYKDEFVRNKNLKSYDEPKTYSDLGKFVTLFQNQTHWEKNLNHDKNSTFITTIKRKIIVLIWHRSWSIPIAKRHKSFKTSFSWLCRRPWRLT